MRLRGLEVGVEVQELNVLQGPWTTAVEVSRAYCK